MVRLQVLNFKRLLHVPLTESLQAPLQFPLLVPLYVFVFDAFCSSLCFWRIFSSTLDDSVGFDLTGGSF